MVTAHILYRFISAEKLDCVEESQGTPPMSLSEDETGFKLIIIITYDFESSRPGSNPEWGPIYTMRLQSLHRVYPSLHPSGVVHWAPEQ